MDSSTYTEASSFASSPVMRPTVDSSVPRADGLESGYASATSSTAGSQSDLPQVHLTPPHLKHLNAQMERLPAAERLRFARLLFPNLYQTTAFGLTGLVTMDMLARQAAADEAATKTRTRPVDVIFLDTLYHFQETYDLVDRVRARYPDTTVHMYRPDGAATTAEFEETYGEGLYEMAEELYDWIAKVEPQQRAYAELNVAAVLTGRRRSQGGARDKIQFIEVDEERGIIKINPLVDWSFAQVQAYIQEHDVPYNVLLDRGYKSVGDWHSTSPVGAGEDERAGRWKGRDKTECGIHNKKSRYAQFLEDQERKAAEDAESEKKQRELEAALEEMSLAQQQQQQQQQQETPSAREASSRPGMVASIEVA